MWNYRKSSSGSRETICVPCPRQVSGLDFSPPTTPHDTPPLAVYLCAGHMAPLCQLKPIPRSVGLFLRQQEIQSPFCSGNCHETGGSLVPLYLALHVVETARTVSFSCNSFTGSLSAYYVQSTVLRAAACHAMLWWRLSPKTSEDVTDRQTLNS